MGLAFNLAAVVTLLTSLSLYSTIKPMFDPPNRPAINDVWWGPGEPSETDTRIRPFKINVSDHVSI